MFYHLPSDPEQKRGSNLMHLFMTDFHFVSPTIITSVHTHGVELHCQGKAQGLPWLTTISKHVKTFEIPL